MPRSPTIQAVLGVATDIARRRQHSVIGGSHVIAALFAAPGMDRRIRRRGLDADHLHDAVERALDDAPAVAAYRDVGPPALSSSLERALERSESYVDAYGAAEIVVALEGTPELRGAFRPYVLDESLVAELRREARGRDVADAMTWLLHRHVDLAARLVDGGLDAEDLTTRCGRSFADVAKNVIENARLQGYARVEPMLLVGALTREIAHEAGYEPNVIGDALDLLVHGPHPDERVADEAPAEVFMFNDPFTAQRTVQTVLMDHFGMSELESADMVMGIDARDGAVVAYAAGAPARELATLATRSARSFGEPLRVVARGRAY